MIQLNRILPILAVAATWIGLCFFPLRSTAEGQELTAEKVRAAIDNGVRFLKSKQEPDGSWRGLASHRPGSTGLICLALLNSGVPATDKTIDKALNYLGSVKQGSFDVYFVSLRIMVYSMANSARYAPEIRRDVNWLIRAQNTSGLANHGGWSYQSLAMTNGDASNSQFALLALHEARLAGIKIDPVVWRRARQYWLNVFDRQQGGFRYSTATDVDPEFTAVKGSMTCAGISSMIIIEENLATEMVGDNLDVRCCRPSMRSESIDRAIAWMADDLHFRVTSNPIYNTYRNGVDDNGTKFYYLYGLERAGRLAGLRFFGNHDWYREGAEHLIKIQNAGSWRAARRVGVESNPQIATAFALLFLAKGRRPIVVGKYRYGKSENWNRHPKGVHYLTRKIEKAWKRKLNWQVVDGRTANVNDLLETPVLFISGREAIDLSDAQVDALRDYLENGGFIFAEACQGDGCGDRVAFDQSFRALMKKVLPDSQFDLLPESHPLWQAHFQLKKINENRPVLGIQASCRTSVIYVPANLSGVWQLNQPGLLEKHNDKAREDIDYTTKLGVNVIAYATNRELKARLERQKVNLDPARTLGSRILEIPKLDHGGGSDDAPNAWRNILRRLRFDRKIPVKLEKRMISPRLDQMQNYPIIFLHGRNKFSFNDQQRAAIREYLARGGFLFADSICSSSKFTESFRKEMKAIFPQQALQPIGKDERIWDSKGYSGYDIRQVTLRTPTRNDRGQAFRTQRTHPVIEGIKIKGRYGVIFSPYDLSCAMENASGSQCKGYNKDDAARIAVNILLYARIEVPKE